MNTPLIHAIELALRAVEAERVTRHYNDARNYTGPRTVQPHEAAEMIAKALVGTFALDWRRVEDATPADDGTVAIAIKGFAEVSLGYLESDENRRWCNLDGLELAGRVYAWAPLPARPEGDNLVGFPPRVPFASATAPDPR